MRKSNKIPRGQVEEMLKRLDKVEELLQRAESGEKTEEVADSLTSQFIKIGEAAKVYGFDGKHSAIKLRNRCAHSHSNDNLWEELSDFRTKFDIIKNKNKRKWEQIVARNSQSKVKRQFEKHANADAFGDEQNRKKTVNAIEDAFDNRISEADKSKFPPEKNIVSQTVESISEDVKKYVGDHPGLSENVQSDILNWSEKTSTEVEIESNAHFSGERDFIEKIQKMGGQNFFDNFDKYENEYRGLTSSDKSFDLRHYKEMMLEDISKSDEKTKDEDYKQAYLQALVKALTNSFNARKAAFEQRLIDEKRKSFLNELYEKIEKFKKLEQLLQPIIDDLGHGYLWDMLNAPFRDMGFDILKKYSSLLENDKALKEFAELLGRQSITSKEVEKKYIKETIIRSEYHPEPAQRGNIVGFEYSNEISKVLPSEISLQAVPDLEDLFYLKFVEKQLLSYRYSQDVAEVISETQLKEIEVTKSKDLTGPIIICVDTSASMHGAPELTAKIATFALAKNAMRQHRKCFLISFSKGIETLDMSNFKKSNALENLVSFLNKSFDGGTDAAPALNECLRQLKTERYSNADVLMISDFVMNQMPQYIVNDIKNEQTKGTFFYSLVIGDSANANVISCFDESITYNPYDELSRRQFLEKVKQIEYKRKLSRKGLN